MGAKHNAFTAYGEEINWNLKYGKSDSGFYIYSKNLAEKYKLSNSTRTKITNLLENRPDLSPNVDETIAYLLNISGERLIREYFERQICPPASEIDAKSKLLKDNNSWLAGSIESQGQILRSDVSLKILQILIALEKSAYDAVNADKIGKLLKGGVTLEEKVLLEKVGFCLSQNMSAEYILSRPKILSDSMPVELLKAVLDEPALQADVDFLDIDRVIEIMEVTPIAPTGNYVFTDKQKFACNIKGRSFVKKYCK